jgi:hypothetical protein
VCLQNVEVIFHLWKNLVDFDEICCWKKSALNVVKKIYLGLFSKTSLLHFIFNFNFFRYGQSWLRLFVSSYSAGSVAKTFYMWVHHRFIVVKTLAVSATFQPLYNKIAYPAANSGFHTVWSLWPHCVKSFIWLNDTLWWCKHGGSKSQMKPQELSSVFLNYPTVWLLQTSAAETVTQLSNSMEQSPFWEHRNHSNVPSFMEPKVHYCLH